MGSWDGDVNLKDRNDGMGFPSIHVLGLGLR